MVDLLVYTNHRMGDMYYNTNTYGSDNMYYNTVMSMSRGVNNCSVGRFKVVESGSGVDMS